jgi:hypothetical protein
MAYNHERRALTPDTIFQAGQLLSEAFPGVFSPDQAVLGITDNIVIAPNFEAWLADERTIAVTLLDAFGNVAALNIAVPLASMDPSRSEPQTAYLYYTAVEKMHQGQGQVWELHEKTFERLRAAGYSAVELDAKMAGSYISNLKEIYGDALAETAPPHDNWGFGLEQPLRIDLDKVPRNTSPNRP